MAPLRTRGRLTERSRNITKPNITKPCALLYTERDHVRVIGGHDLGYPSHIHTELVWSQPATNLPFLGVKMHFPRSPDDCAAFFLPQRSTPSPTHTLTMKFMIGSFTSRWEHLPDELFTALPAREGAETVNRMALFHIILHPGQQVIVQNVGIPFLAASPIDDGIVDGGRPVQGFKSLRAIFSQTVFTILLKDRAVLPHTLAESSNHLPGRTHRSSRSHIPTGVYLSF